MKKLIALLILICMFSMMLIGCEGVQTEDKKNNSNLNDQEYDNNDAQTPNDEQTPGDEQTPDDEQTPGDEQTPDNNTDDSTTELPEYGTEVGDRFMDISIEGLNGEEISTSDYRGKFIILNVWGTWCGPCKSELPAFNQFASDYKDEVVIIAAHSYYYREYAKDYVDQNFPSTSILFGYDTADGYVFTAAGGSQYYPRTMIISPEGVILYGHDGLMSYDLLESIIEANK